MHYIISVYGIFVNMTQFLKQVAAHYCDERGPEGLCFIFPNRRALVFFRKYLGECVAASGSPVFAPLMFTMNDFFYRAAGARATDRVILLKRLYDCYRPLYEKSSGSVAETLDEFIFWGSVIMSDFDDVDKYLVDPERIFTNISEFRNMQTDFSFLTENQREALERFLGHFRDEGDFKHRFSAMWDLLLPLYRDFNALLSSQSLSYEGKVYRELAERLASEPAVDILKPCFGEVKKYIFVGLNALNECEKLLMRKLRDAGKAEFCWDFSSPMIRNGWNKSSFFMKTNVEMFPQAFSPDPEGLPVTEFNLLSVPSAVGQAKQLPEIFSRIGRTDITTAVVIPDETLLLPVLNSIPEEIDKLNVTMGYPLSGSAIWPLFNDISALQMNLRRKDGIFYFYHRQVWSILSNSLVGSLLSDEGRKICTAVREDHSYYITADAFAGDPLLECIFRPVVEDVRSADPSLIKAIGAYQLEVLETVASGIKASVTDDDLEDGPVYAGMAMELDFAKAIYLSVKRLMAEDFGILPATYFKLLRQLVSGSSVPFKGEPLKGLQIMGPLETRALDFENIVLLSCNEGVFPRRNVASSFVPPELRKGFGLPTYEFQDAVWAYYFYRMIQRARRVWMLYDSRTEGVRGGEMSRYVRQLELHFGVKVNHFVADSAVGEASVPAAVKKLPEHIERLKDGCLSASSLQNYLFCPAKFFYSKVEGLKKEDEVAESLDSGMLGDVFHRTMQSLYSEGNGTMSLERLQRMLRERERISGIVRGHIMERLRTFEVSGRNLICEDIILRYVMKTLSADIEYLKSCGVTSMKILGLESKKYSTMDGFRIMGIMDRIDSVAPGQVRVVDYKTGKVTDEDFRIDADNAEKVVGALFGTDNSKRPKIALQLYLYDYLMQQDADGRGRRIENSIYQPVRLFTGKVENVALNTEFCELMRERIGGLLAEISDPAADWKRTDDTRTCDICDFKKICGR